VGQRKAPLYFYFGSVQYLLLFCDVPIKAAHCKRKESFGATTPKLINTIDQKKKEVTI
jgi:hypothetical protein